MESLEIPQESLRNPQGIPRIPCSYLFFVGNLLWQNMGSAFVDGEGLVRLVFVLFLSGGVSVSAGVPFVVSIFLLF